jgi:hypothetical protein
MKAICDYVKRSESTVLDWIRNWNFPAQKIGGIWESDRELIDQWRKEQIGGVAKKEQPRKAKKGDKKSHSQKTKSSHA